MMVLLIAGVMLWSLAHLLKRLAPSLRESMGAGGRGLIAVAIVLSLGLMVMGYQQAETTHLWGRHPVAVGINNLLMLLAVYLMVVSFVKSALVNRVRHPQLSAVKAWAIAHLLVNGDTASFVLFGGLLIWAVLSVILISKAGKPALAQRPFSWGREWLSLGLSVLVFGVIAMAHKGLGYPVFG
jgi:uncharacterized membrane protein